MTEAVLESKQSRPSFKQQMLEAREHAIVRAVNRLLARKGYDAMTVDEVAAEVGIAKASLYSHFQSKEALATAAMVAAIRSANTYFDTLPADADAITKIKCATRWSMEQAMAENMPSLPSQNSALRTALTTNPAYLDALVHMSDRMGQWIEEAQLAGQIDPALPPVLVFYTLLARACDPVPEFLRMTGQYTDAQIMDFVMHTCFAGLKKNGP